MEFPKFRWKQGLACKSVMKEMCQGDSSKRAGEVEQVKEAAKPGLNFRGSLKLSLFLQGAPKEP